MQYDDETDLQTTLTILVSNLPVGKTNFMTQVMHGAFQHSLFR